MPKSVEEQSDPELRDSLATLIGRNVLRALGTPKDLLKVRVHPVAVDTYRVNVVTGKDYPSGRIANSYFLTADDKGKITDSKPTIVKSY